MNPAKAPGLSLFKNKFQRVVVGWMNVVGVGHYSFVNIQHRPGRFSPTDEEVDFLQSVLALHKGKIVVMGSVTHAIVSRYTHNYFKAPHPSGLNRKLNSAPFVEKFLADLAGYINNPEVHDGSVPFRRKGRPPGKKKVQYEDSAVSGQGC